MVVVAHPGQTLVGIGHEDSGRVKVLAGLYRVAEQAVVDAHYQTGLVVLVKLGLCQKTSGIHKGEAVAGAEIFGRCPLCQSDEGILLMGGDAAAAADLVYMVSQGLTLNLPLLAVPARQGDQIQILSVHIVHVHRHDPLELDGLFSAVVYPGGAHDDVRLLKDRIQESDLDIGHRILYGQLQSIDSVVFCCKGSRQPLQSKGPLIHPVRDISSVEGEASVGILYFDRIDPEISLLLCCKFLRLGIQRESTLLQGFIGIARESAVILPDQIDQILVVDGCPVVEMFYIVEIADLQLVGRFGSMKGKGLFGFVVHNGHGKLLILAGGGSCAARFLLKYSILRILPEPVLSHISMYAVYGLFCDIFVFPLGNAARRNGPNGLSGDLRCRAAKNSEKR